MMKRSTTLFNALLTLCLLGQLTACGGGSGSDSTHTVKLQNTDSSAISTTENTTPTLTDTPQTANAISTTGNTTPTLTGTPQAAITVGDEYRFQPVSFDADGDTLIFNIQNGPVWLAFNAADGSLSGTPTVSDIGTDDNIVITVSDGTDSATIGPFSLVVNDVPAAQTPTRKYNPGHYIDLLRWQTTSGSDNYLIDTIKPGVTGVQVRYLWADFETSPGVYDFSRIQHDLELLSNQGLHLIVVVSDKTFKDEQPIPDYLASYTLPNRQRWLHRGTLEILCHRALDQANAGHGQTI